MITSKLYLKFNILSFQPSHKSTILRQRDNLFQ